MCFKRSLPAASVKGPQGSRTFLSYTRMCSDPPFIIVSLRMLKSSHRMKKLLEERWYCMDLVSSPLYLIMNQSLLLPPSTPTKVILTAK